MSQYKAWKITKDTYNNTQNVENNTHNKMIPLLKWEQCSLASLRGKPPTEKQLYYNNSQENLSHASYSYLFNSIF
jgi:hypothetical protein